MSFRSTDSRPDAAPPSPRVFLHNLAFSLTYLDVLSWLRSIGHPPEEVALHRGTAIATYRTTGDATAALTTLNGPGMVVAGRQVRADFAKPTPPPAPTEPDAPKTIDPRRLIVTSLWYARSREDVEHDLRALCLRLAIDPVEIVMPVDRATAKHRGIAFLTFATDAGASKALEKLEGAVLDGRTIAVSRAYARPPRRPPADWVVDRMARPGRTR